MLTTTDVGNVTQDQGALDHQVSWRFQMLQQQDTRNPCFCSVTCRHHNTSNDVQKRNVKRNLPVHLGPPFLRVKPSQPLQLCGRAAWGGGMKRGEN